MKKIISIILTIALSMSTFVGASCFATKNSDNTTETYDAVQEIYNDGKSRRNKKIKTALTWITAAAAAFSVAAIGAAKMLFKETEKAVEEIKNGLDNGKNNQSYNKTNHHTKTSKENQDTKNDSILNSKGKNQLEKSKKPQSVLTKTIKNKNVNVNDNNTNGGNSTLDIPKSGNNETKVVNPPSNFTESGNNNTNGDNSTLDASKNGNDKTNGGRFAPDLPQNSNNTNGRNSTFNASKSNYSVTVVESSTPKSPKDVNNTKGGNHTLDVPKSGNNDKNKKYSFETPQNNNNTNGGNSTLDASKNSSNDTNVVNHPSGGSGNKGNTGDVNPLSGDTEIGKNNTKSSWLNWVYGLVISYLIATGACVYKAGVENTGFCAKTVGFGYLFKYKRAFNRIKDMCQNAVGAKRVYRNGQWGWLPIFIENGVRIVGESFIADTTLK